MFDFIKSPVLRQYAVVILVNVSIFTTGMNLVWSSPMLVKLSNETQTSLSHAINEEEGSWIVSVEFIFAFIFNALVAMLLDSIGRKYCVVLGCVPKIIGVAIYIVATEVWMLIVARLLFGLSDSFILTSVSVYTSEIATKNTRGASCTLVQIFSSLGIVLTLSAGPFLSYKVFNMMFAVIIVVTGIPIFLLPESPYFLYNKGQEKDAINVLKFLHGSEQLAMQEIEEYSLSSKQEKVNKISILKNPTVRKSLVISVIFSIGCQMVGYNAVSYYLQTILISTHTSIMPEIASVIIGVIQFVSSFLTMFTTDRFGRKIILITSLIGMTIGLIGLGIFFKLKPPDSEPLNGFLNSLPLISLVIVVYCYNAGIGSLVWVTVTELFDGPARAFGVAVNLGVNTTLIFLTTKYFPMLISKVGPAITYWSFAVVSILMCLFIIFFLPETKGKSFGEIQDDIAKKKIKEGIEETTE